MAKVIPTITIKTIMQTRWLAVLCLFVGVTLIYMGAHTIGYRAKELSGNFIYQNLLAGRNVSDAKLDELIHSRLAVQESHIFAQNYEELSLAYAEKARRKAEKVALHKDGLRNDSTQLDESETLYKQASINAQNSLQMAPANPYMWIELAYLQFVLSTSKLGQVAEQAPLNSQSEQLNTRSEQFVSDYIVSDNNNNHERDYVSFYQQALTTGPFEPRLLPIQAVLGLRFFSQLDDTTQQKVQELVHMSWRYNPKQMLKLIKAEQLQSTIAAILGDDPVSLAEFQKRLRFGF